MLKRLIVFMLVLTLLTACSGNADAPSTDLTVVMNEFTYSPKVLTVPAGEEITIKLDNQGAILHNFIILKAGAEASMPFNEDDQPNIFWSAEAQPGQAVTLTFTAPTEAGEYQVVCGVQGHLESGMLGKLIVVKP